MCMCVPQKYLKWYVLTALGHERLKRAHVCCILNRTQRCFGETPTKCLQVSFSHSHRRRANAVLDCQPTARPCFPQARARFCGWARKFFVTCRLSVFSPFRSVVPSFHLLRGHIEESALFVLGRALCRLDITFSLPLLLCSSHISRSPVAFFSEHFPASTLWSTTGFVCRSRVMRESGEGERTSFAPACSA